MRFPGQVDADYAEPEPGSQDFFFYSLAYEIAESEGSFGILYYFGGCGIGVRYLASELLRD